MAEQNPLESPIAVTVPAELDRSEEVAPDLSYKKIGISNVAFYGRPGEAGWVLIDAGVPGSADEIYRAAAERFGEHVPPSAIVLTHAHFDHAGALPELAAEWETPIYAHWQEHPFLTGARAYPPPPKGTISAGAGQLWSQGRRQPLNVSRWLGLLSGNVWVPFMPGWRVIPTPGHSPGHVSLWREADRTLIAGDAVISTWQECAYGTLAQKPELQGPPQHYTPDWEAARESARRLAALEPELLLTGHGPALRGVEMREALRLLAEDYEQIARPGRIRA